MQVSQVNSSAASALGQTSQAEESRADDFARLLKSAFSGKGEAVAKTTERALTDAAPRTETRRQERTAERSPERSSYDRRDDYRAERNDTRRSDDAAQRDTAPVNRTEDKAPARNDDQPAKDTKAADTTKPAKTEDTAQKADDAPVADKAADAKDAAPVADKPVDAKGEATVATEDKPADEAKPTKVAVPDDMLMILHLLQQEVGPVTQIAAAQAGVTTATTTVAAPSAEEAAAAALAAAAAEAGKTSAVPAETVAKPAVPVDAKAAALAAAATPADAKAAAEAVAQAAAGAAAKTETSAAALLAQQEVAKPEDLAAIQQALTAQSQSQGQVQTEVQAQTAKPVLTAEPKTTPKTEKSLTLDVQTVTAAATPKTLVDQSSLFAMQGDDHAADAALLQQQAQQAQAVQQNATELKFNTALLQAHADSLLQTATGTAGSTNNAGQAGQQQVAPMSATANAPATQATQQATAQTTARHLNTYVPAGEQVAVQIKKGVAEGVDKISIKLDPGNLGKVEIKLEIGHDGRLTAIVAADKPETLQLLQQDVKNLEQSLRDSGLKTDQQSLSFTLRDQGQGNDGRDGQGGGYGRQRGRSGDDYADGGMHTDPAQLAAANAQRAAAARGGLDIKI